MLTYSVVLLHDYACPPKSTASRPRALLENFNWELFDHPPYSPDLTPSDCHLFTYLKNWLASQHLNNNEELMEGAKTWLSSQAADFFDIGTQKFIPDITNASILAVTRSRSCLSMHVFFPYNNFFSLIVLLTAHRRLLAE
jgi:hypothetical protein